MKVTVKEKRENEIDFSVKGQMLEMIRPSGKRLLVITDGNGGANEFGASLFYCEEGILNVEQNFQLWLNKHEFKKFNGTITIEQ
jgi:hypothetical protein